MAILDRDRAERMASDAIDSGHYRRAWFLRGLVDGCSAPDLREQPSEPQWLGHYLRGLAEGLARTASY